MKTFTFISNAHSMFYVNCIGMNVRYFANHEGGVINVFRADGNNINLNTEFEEVLEYVRNVTLPEIKEKLLNGTSVDELVVDIDEAYNQIPEEDLNDEDDDNGEF